MSATLHPGTLDPGPGTPADGGFACEDAARAALIEACRRMLALGLNQGRSGNASLRWDRGGAPGLLVTPSAIDCERMAEDDIVWVSMAGQADGAHPPSSEWRIHRDLYAARADAVAVVHAHPPFATTLACSARVQREGIPPFHYMIAMLGGEDVRCAPYATFGTQALSDHALAALAGRQACLLANHGAVALGDSPARALAMLVELESLARVYWQALQLGDPVLLDPAQMREALARFADYGRR